MDALIGGGKTHNYMYFPPRNHFWRNFCITRKQTSAEKLPSQAPYMFAILLRCTKKKPGCSGAGAGSQVVLRPAHHLMKHKQTSGIFDCVSFPLCQCATGLGDAMDWWWQEATYGGGKPPAHNKRPKCCFCCPHKYITPPGLDPPENALAKL